MDVHLGEERDEGAPEGSDHPSNHRNGSSQKTVTTDSGKVVLDTPAWESAASHPA
jgi:putative transposase